ncbi:Serine/arginine repetitive matrix protein 1 [Tolypocladium ophioglossoides CBS 100239]|uniref:Serine/arginine repetitive matrix protein 1 n=1 Tax=Tolypocladium ophioglossoides (strain CBS 100239) TaxID=1163406 RepID=A0A0L0N7S9_TOLOC|nr:Serine/arginine repetitive matrix protein 1 [Tolypocladium ophioglossoides CBS 100239]
MASKVDARLLKSTKFPPEFNQKVDMTKVNLQVMKKWIGKHITQVLGNDDDVLIELCVNLLETSRYPDIKAVQIQLTGFLEKDTAPFCKELWNLLLSAQASPQGVPKELLEAKKLELIQTKRMLVGIVTCQPLRNESAETDHSMQIPGTHKVDAGTEPLVAVAGVVMGGLDNDRCHLGHGPVARETRMALTATSHRQDGVAMKSRDVAATVRPLANCYLGLAPASVAAPRRATDRDPPPLHAVETLQFGPNMPGTELGPLIPMLFRVDVAVAVEAAPPCTKADPLAPEAAVAASVAPGASVAAAAAAPAAAAAAAAVEVAVAVASPGRNSAPRNRQRESPVNRGRKRRYSSPSDGSDSGRGLGRGRRARGGARWSRGSRRDSAGRRRNSSSESSRSPIRDKSADVLEDQPRTKSPKPIASIEKDDVEVGTS